MALNYVPSVPLDPYIYTGPTRLMSGPVRTGTVVLGTPYGPNGNLEFASWLYVGTTGNISYVKWDGTSQTLTNVTAGIWQNIYSTAINTAGTTAGGLVWGS